MSVHDTGMTKLGRSDICVKDNLTANLLAILAFPTSSERTGCDPHLNRQGDAALSHLAAAL